MLRGVTFLITILGLTLSIWHCRCELGPSSDTNGIVSNDSQEQLRISRRLAERCREIYKMKYLSHMQELIDLVRETNSVENVQASQSSYLTKLSSPYSCLNHSPEILDLEALISERENVCKSSHIDKIEAYFKKHLTGWSRYLTITKKFFHLYAHQVSLICKRNLLHNLNQAGEQLANSTGDGEPITMETYERIIPWMNKRLIRVCSNENWPKAETKAKCESMEVLSSIDTIDELATAIDSSGKNRVALERKQIMKNNSYQALTNQKLVDDDDDDYDYYDEDNNENKQHENDELVESSEISEKVATTLPVSVRSQVNTIRELCFRLKPIYSNTVLPIVRLAQLELDTEYEEFDRKCAEEETLKLWFSVTIVCESALTSNLASNFIQVTNTISAANDKKAIEQNEIIDELLDNPSFLNENPIEDELWIGNYRTHSLTRFKYTIMGKLLRTLKINQLFESIALDKNFRNAGDIVFGIVVAAVSVAGMAANIS